MIRRALFASALGAIVPSCTPGTRQAQKAMAADGDGERITVDESLPLSRAGAEQADRSLTTGLDGWITAIQQNGRTPGRRDRRR